MTESRIDGACARCVLCSEEHDDFGPCPCELPPDRSKFSPPGTTVFGVAMVLPHELGRKHAGGRL